jgi:heme-degrading monooxygenase HmoA
MHVVELEVTPGEETRLLNDFASRFRPAIASQPGFVSVQLLQPREGATWLMLIDFASDNERLAWVATPLHAQVWPLLARSCDAAQGADFDQVGR